MSPNTDMLEALRSAEDANQMFDIILKTEENILQKKLPVNLKEWI
jgi:hypothetical protein